MKDLFINDKNEAVIVKTSDEELICFFCKKEIKQGWVCTDPKVIDVLCCDNCKENEVSIENAIFPFSGYVGQIEMGRFSIRVEQLDFFDYFDNLDPIADGETQEELKC